MFSSRLTEVSDACGPKFSAAIETLDLLFLYSSLSLFLSFFSSLNGVSSYLLISRIILYITNPSYFSISVVNEFHVHMHSYCYFRIEYIIKID